MSMFISRDQVSVDDRRQLVGRPVFEAKLATLTSRAAGVGSTSSSTPAPRPFDERLHPDVGVPLLDFVGARDRVDGPPLKSGDNPRRHPDRPQHQAPGPKQSIRNGRSCD